MIVIRKVTLQDVAHKAEVSKSTVSQYLNGRYTYMGDKTKERIENAIKELNYQPNAIARSLKQKHTTTIGVIMANVMHRFSTQTSRAIEDFCHLNGYHVILCNADDDSSKEYKYIEMLKAKQVDGFIIFPTASSEEKYKSLLEEDYPLVFLDRKVEGLQIPSIVLKNKKASFEIVNHLIEQGSRKIAFVSSPLTISPRLERFQGYEEALEKANIPINERFIYTGNLEEAPLFFNNMFSGIDKPDAILTGNDRALMRTLSYIKENEPSLVNELKLATFDEVEFAEFYSPTITTLEQPAYDMGRRAAEVLLEQIKDKHKAAEQDLYYEFDGILNIRDSSKNKKGVKK